MNQYNPEVSPNPKEWIELDEQLRIILIEKYHLQKHVKLSDPAVHATFHSIIESQIAEKLAPVLRAMVRLTDGGLTRHEAVHAVASVLAEHIHDQFEAKDNLTVSQARYTAAVERLTVNIWLNR